MKLTTEQIDEAERHGLLMPERPLHRVQHFGQWYQWYRRADGQHVMRPEPDYYEIPATGTYAIG